jgi:hypothetical protein
MKDNEEVFLHFPEYDQDGLIGKIMETVKELDRMSFEGHAVLEMPDDEWKLNIGKYVKEFTNSDDDFNYDDDGDGLWYVVLFKYLHEDAEQEEAMLECIQEDLENRFNKTVNLKIENGVTKVTIEELTDKNRGRSWTDNRIVPLEIIGYHYRKRMERRKRTITEA